MLDTFCHPGEPPKQEGEERKRASTVSEECDHMSTLHAFEAAKLETYFSLALHLHFFQDSIQNVKNSPLRLLLSRQLYTIMHAL